MYYLTELTQNNEHKTFKCNCSRGLAFYKAVNISKECMKAASSKFEGASIHSQVVCASGKVWDSKLDKIGTIKDITLLVPDYIIQV